MRAVVGIDPDSKFVSAVILREGLPPKLRRKRLSGTASIAKKLDGVWLWAYRLVKELRAEGYEVFVFVEAPFVSPKFPGVAVPLSRIGGCLMAASIRGGATVVEPAIIQDWKKAIVGKGNAGKPDVARWVKREWRAVWDEAQGRQDLLDAHCIALYGERVVRNMAKVHGWQDKKVDVIPSKKSIQKMRKG